MSEELQSSYDSLDCKRTNCLKKALDIRLHLADMFWLGYWAPIQAPGSKTCHNWKLELFIRHSFEGWETIMFEFFGESDACKQISMLAIGKGVCTFLIKQH